MQEELLLRTSHKDVSDNIILASCKTFKDALKLSKSLSGLDDKQLISRLNIDAGQWSRIWSSNAHFPEEKLEQFMDLCGNLIPLRYLALKYGFGLSPLKSKLELELDKKHAENEELQKKLAYFEELLGKVKL